jgi:helix-turn-helix protein
MKKKTAPRLSPALPLALTDDPLLTGKEVCRILRITPRTLYRKRVTKQITGIAVSERRYLYRTSAIRRYLELAESGAFNPMAVDGR